MRVPKYRKHSSGQARVTIQGRDFLLGGFGSEESKAAYRRIVGEFIASGGSPVFREKPASLTMAQVLLAYLNHAKTYYKVGTEYVNLELACRPVADLYSDLLASAFGAVEYKACRHWWLADPKRTRQYVNKQSKRLVRIIKWATGEGLMPIEGYQTIKCIEPLKRGRVTAPESQGVKPVSDSMVQAVLPHLGPIVADMVRFQQLTGCRPGEVCKLKPSMVDRTSEVWTIALNDHKTAYRGKQRTIYVGPQSQVILLKYLLRGSDEYCFSPKESEAIRRASLTAARKTPPSCGNRPGSHVVAGKRKKEPGGCYTTLSYGRSIQYGCEKAFPAPDGLDDEQLKAWRNEHSFAPNQLRHSAATKIRAKFGLESASSVLGHSEIGVTQIYAEADMTRAIEVARLIG